MPWDTTINQEADDYEDEEWYEDENYYDWIPYPISRRERFDCWLRRTRYYLILRLSDPFARLRHCSTCGKRGCIPTERQCGGCWTPF